MQLANTLSRTGARSAARPAPRNCVQARRRVVTHALNDTNFFLNLFASGTAGAIAAAVTVVTAENTDKELERIQTISGAAPLAAGILADTVAHSIPGLNVLFNLVAEPVGAAAGVAYMMSVLLSSPAVNPNTLEPKGTVLNAEKAADARAAVRVPFTRIVPTAIKVVDTSNDSSSGAGWTTGPDGLPKLPITSVAVVVGVGTLILEAAAHAPVVSIFLPRVFQVAGWLAAAGYVLDNPDNGISLPDKPISSLAGGSE